MKRKDIQLNRIITILLLLGSLNSWSVCQNEQLFTFNSLEDLNKLAFEDCTTTRSDNRKKCECQKHNSKIIPDVSPQLQTETQIQNKDELKKNVHQNIDEMIQYFLALETNIELSEQAAQACSLARIQKIKCTHSKMPVMNHIYPNGVVDLVKQSQCQLKQKYNIPCDYPGWNQVKKSNSCFDEGTRLALIFKQREQQDYLERFRKNLLNSTAESLKDEVHPALKLILQEVNLQKQFLALPAHQLQSFVKSPALNQMISQNITLACEQKMQNMQSLLCYDVNDLNQIPLKSIIKTEKVLVKQKPKDIDQIINYQQQLNLFCQNLDKPSLEKSMLELSKSAMPTTFENVLEIAQNEFDSACSKLNPPINNSQILLALKSCQNTELEACRTLKNLSELYQIREQVSPTLTNNSETSKDQPPIFFSKQLKTFFGENTNPALIQPQPEGSKVSVANYHEEMLERDQARERAHTSQLAPQTIMEITKTNNVVPVVSSSGAQIVQAPLGNDFEFYNHASSDQVEMTKRQAQFLEHERKNNSQIMKHFQNINQKQIDMIEKMANKIIEENEIVEHDSNKNSNEIQTSKVNSPPQIIYQNANKQSTIQADGKAVTEPQNQIVYIDNSQTGTRSEKFHKSSNMTNIEAQASNSSTLNAIGRGPASQENESALQHVEVIHKDHTMHKKYDEIIVSLDLSEGDQLSKLKPHELEKISKYLEEKRPFILKKILRNNNNASKNIDATILIGDKSYITIIPNKKISSSEQKEYLLIKKELENIMKLKLSQNTLDISTTSHL